MLQYDFMQLGFAGSFLAAVMASVVGWFLLLRGQAFAAHALPHIGFSGAAAAAWLGFSPGWGMMLIPLAAGLLMGAWEAPFVTRFFGFSPGNGHSAGGRDLLVALVLTGALALGAGCLYAARAPQQQALNLLFGDVLALDGRNVLGLAFLLAGIMGALVLIGRKLLFSALQPELAQARGVPVGFVSMIFMGLAGLASAGAAEVCGALLAFSLMIGPPAACHRLGLDAAPGLLCSAILAVCLCWGALCLSWLTDWPAVFWIGLGAVLLYGAAGILSQARGKFIR